MSFTCHVTSLYYIDLLILIFKEVNMIKFLSCLIILSQFYGTNCFSKDNYEKAGDLGELLLPATAYAITFLKHDKKGRNMFYKSYFSAVALSSLLKITIPKDRPNGGKHSYISGHTTAAFSGAAFMQRRYGWKIGAPSYFFATYVGWSRYHAKKHYVNDIARGAAIGIISAYYFTKPIGKNAFMYPIMGEGKYGIMICKRW